MYYKITKGVLAINCSNSFSHCKRDQKKTVAISQMFNDVLLHVLFYSILSHNLGGSSGTTDEFATIPFHLDLFSAALVELAKSIPVHSLILSSHLFFCLPLFLFPFTVPCRIVFAKPEDLETWPNHLSFRFLTRVRSSSYSPMAAWIFLRTSSLVTWSLYDMLSSLRLHLISKACVLFSNSAVKVYHSQAYKNMEMTRERISFTFDPRDMLLSLQMGFSFVRVAMACAILEKTSGLEPSSETTAPRYSKLVTVPNFCPFTLISLWMPLALFVISLVYSALISILYLVQVLSRHSTRASSSCCSSARASMSSANRRLVIFLPPMLTFPSCSSRASDMIRSRKMLKRVGDRRHPCQTPTVVLNHSPMLPFIWTALVALL